MSGPRAKPDEQAPENDDAAFDPGIVLRPRSLDETIDLSLAYARVHWRASLTVAAAFVLPVLGAILAAQLWFGLSWGITWAIAFSAAPIVERMTIGYGGRHLFGRGAPLLAGLRAVWRRPILTTISAAVIPLPWAPLLISELEDAEGWIGLAVLLGVPWLFGLAQTLYVSLVAVLEEVGGREALKRASGLVAMRYGRALGFVIIGVIIRLGAALVVELAAVFAITFLLQLGEPIDRLFSDGGSWPSVAGYLLAAPFVALVRLFDYVDARTQREGWDIQVRFKAIAARARAQRASRGTDGGRMAA